MNKSRVGLSIIEPVVRKFAKKVADTDDAAVAEYVRKQLDWLANMGEPIQYYALVRETHTELTGMKVVYKIEYKIEYVGPEEDASNET